MDCVQVNFWERLRMTIPYTAMEVNAQRERYRILRVNVMTVVRMYNKVQPGSVSAVRPSFHASMCCTFCPEALKVVRLLS